MISHVNGEPTQGMELNEVVSRLKGPRGTAVKIKIMRPGVEEPLEMSVIRDEIAKFTISNAFRIRDKIGYIKLDSFAETTGAELEEALRKLDYQTLGRSHFRPPRQSRRTCYRKRSKSPKRSFKRAR